jgi:hypothetical protein
VAGCSRDRRDTAHECAADAENMNMQSLAPEFREYENEKEHAPTSALQRKIEAQSTAPREKK